MRMHPIWRRGPHPESGSVLVFWALSIVVLLGMVALSFDIGRIAATQSELQSYADNLALAAAAELDGEDNSIDRAIAAAQTLIQDRQTFLNRATRELGNADFDLVFYRRGGTDDGNRITPDLTNPAAIVYLSGDQVAARFVRAVVAPAERVRTPFAAVLGLITGNALTEAAVAAEAVAGMEEFACDITPLMFCIPQPEDGVAWRSEDAVGQMIRLRTGGSGAAWGPGNFGFLDPSDDAITLGGPCKGLSGAKLDACLIAADRAVAGCFSQEGVDMGPGQKTGNNASAFNVFFDIYDSTVNSLDKDPDYPAAPNVIKGIAPKGGGKCIQGNYALSGALPLPRDDCFYDGNCDNGNRIGDGDWSTNRQTYINTNHAGTDPTATRSLPEPFDGTRYEMYLAEVQLADELANQKPSKDLVLASGSPEGGEDVGPTCSGTVGSANRRVLTVAAIDCVANAISGAKKDVPVTEFIRIFLTEPVGYPLSKVVKKDKNNKDVEDFFFDDSEAFDIHVEVLGSAEKDTAVGAATVRRVVRLLE